MVMDAQVTHIIKWIIALEFLNWDPSLSFPKIKFRKMV